MISEAAFRYAMGEEVDEIPHDYDSLSSWVWAFLIRYQAECDRMRERNEQSPSKG